MFQAIRWMPALFALSASASHHPIESTDNLFDITPKQARAVASMIDRRDQYQCSSITLVWQVRPYYEWKMVCNRGRYGYIVEREDGWFGSFKFTVTELSR